MANEIKNAEMSTLSVGMIVETLSKCYVSVIKSKANLKDFPSVMLWGQPGAGKSQAVREIAKNIESSTGKAVHMQDVRLLLFNPIDLKGIPVADEKKTKAVWLTPELFQLNPSDDVVNILLLDEISAAPQSVQAAAYQLVLDRKVGEHKLPDNTIIIAAGNRVTDKSVSYKMPKALANRFLHFEVSTNLVSWQEWAIKKGIHPLLMGFLAFRPDYLNTFDASNESLAFATPRSWELVSNILNNVSDNINDVYHLIAGLVGSGIAIELKSWYRIYSKLPKLEEVYKGNKTVIPTDSSAVFALCCALIKNARDNDISIDKLLNSVEYATNFPKEFFLMLTTEYVSISEAMKKKLISEPEFVRLVGNNSIVMNGKVNNGYFKNRN